MTHKESLYPSEQPRMAPTQPGVKVSQPWSCTPNSGNKPATTVGQPETHHLPGEVKPSLCLLLSGPTGPCRTAELCDITDGEAALAPDTRPQELLTNRWTPKPSNKSQIQQRSRTPHHFPLFLQLLRTQHKS